MRFYTLDAMRGVAAIAVVLLHIALQLSFRPRPLAYMAVDFFFMLSGFVLATAYEERFRYGLTVSDFLSARFVRLYPMYFFGMVIGTLTLFGQNAMQSGHSMPAPQSMVAILAGFFMLPDPQSPFLFPINQPAWSLFFEFLINIVFSALLVRFSTRVLTVLTIGFGAAYVAGTIHHGQMTGGLSWDSFGLGLVRVTFPFSLGVLFSRLRPLQYEIKSGRAMGLIFTLLIILLIPVGSVPVTAFNLLVTMVVMPALLWFGIRWQLSSRLTGLGAALGDLSYPLYAIHFPAMRIASFGAKALHVPPLAFTLVFLTGSCAAALAVARFVDPPARKLLARCVASIRTWQILGRTKNA